MQESEQKIKGIGELELATLVVMVVQKQKDKDDRHLS